jgi:hypothetical protein
VATQVDQILAAFEQRFKHITQANGFHTNAGLNIFDSRTYFDWQNKNEFPCISIFWPEERAEASNEVNKVLQVMSVLVEAHAITNTLNPGQIMRELITDIKQAAIDQHDLTLKGLVKSIKPVELITQAQTDSNHIVSVRLSYEIRYIESF